MIGWWWWSFNVPAVDHWWWCWYIRYHCLCHIVVVLAAIVRGSFFTASTCDNSYPRQSVLYHLLGSLQFPCRWVAVEVEVMIVVLCMKGVWVWIDIRSWLLFRPMINDNDDYDTLGLIVVDDQTLGVLIDWWWRGLMMHSLLLLSWAWMDWTLTTVTL